jgi:hypothetical protein
VVFLPFALKSGLEYNTSTNSYTQSLYVTYIKDSAIDVAVRSAYVNLYTNTSIPNQKWIWDYYDWKILTINGQEAMSFVLDYVDTSVFYSKDKPTRFNYALSDAWYMRNLRNINFPSTDKLTLVLQNKAGNNQTTVKVSYFAMPYFFEVDHIYDMLNQCGYIPAGKKKRSTQQPRITEGEQELLDSMYPLKDVPANRDADQKITPTYDPKRTLLQVSPIFSQRLMSEMSSYYSVQAEAATIRKKGEPIEVVTNGMSIFTFYNVPYISFTYFFNGTAVLALETFLPADVYAFIVAVKSAATIAANRGANHLIIDLSKNGGGYNCLAFSIAQYLIPWLPNFEIMEPAQDTILTPESASYYRCPNIWMYYGYYWYDAATQSLLSGSGDLVSRTRWISRGGVISQYSRLYSGQCIPEFSLGESPLQLSSQNLTLLTRGTCGSACGFFLKVLRFTNNARVVSYGGIYEGPNMPESDYVTVSSFDGASVMSYDFIAQTMRAVSSLDLCTFDEIIDYLPSYGSMTFSYTEQYPYDTNSLFNKTAVNTDLPLEWNKITADYHLWRWDDGDKTSLYGAVANAVTGKCLSWELKAAECATTIDFEHAVYGHPCVNNRFDTSQCILFRCTPGYFLSADRTRCVQQINANPATAASITDYFIGLAFTLFGVLMFVALGATLLVGAVVLVVLVVRNKKRIAGSLYVERAQLNI